MYHYTEGCDFGGEDSSSARSYPARQSYCKVSVKSALAFLLQGQIEYVAKQVHGPSLTWHEHLSVSHIQEAGSHNLLHSLPHL